MIHLSTRILHTHQLVWSVALCLFVVACGTKEGPVVASDRLCGGTADVALSVKGDGNATAALCAATDSVSARLTSGGRYEFRAGFEDEAGRYALEMVMHQRDDAPVKLTVTDSLAEVSGNPDAVWIRYTEFPRGGAPLESYSVTGGTFTLSFSDPTVAAGTMSGIALGLRETASGADAGTRLIAEGFFTFLTTTPAPESAARAGD